MAMAWWMWPALGGPVLMVVGEAGCRMAGERVTRPADQRSAAWRGVTLKLDVSGSGSGGGPAARRWGWPQAMNPSGGFLRTTLRRFFGSVAGLGQAGRSFSTTCSGACTTTRPVVSNPAPAGPAGDLVETRGALQQAGSSNPSYFDPSR